ncbi:MAG: M14 family zinc carboxypeptidase, partial [Anaerolineaceae bacterium]
MKSGLRSIKLLLILVLISFIGITPASSAKELNLPDPYDCYRSYVTINSRMAELTDLYPGLVRVKTIGQSFEGRPIQVLQLGRDVETNTKPRLVLVSGLQANALAPVELNLLFAETLLNAYGEDANASW